MPVITMGGGGGGVRIPLEAPTGLILTAKDASILISWTDPVNKVANPGGEAVSTWLYSVLVRKTGSAPKSMYDGTVIVKETVRNKYKSSPFTDSGLVNGIKYYYGVFSVNTIGMSGPGITGSATPSDAFPTFTGHFTISDNNQLYAASLTNTKNHFVLAGGANRDTGYTCTNKISAYTHDVTEVPVAAKLKDGAGLKDMASFSMNGCAVFAGGRNASYFRDYLHIISDSLTLINTTTARLMSGCFPGLTVLNDEVAFSAGAYSADGYGETQYLRYINKDWTTWGAQAVYSRETFFAAAGSTLNHSIFYGGMEYNGWIALNPVFSVTKDGTVTNLTSATASACCMVAGGSFNGKAVFAGGQSSGQGGSPGSNLMYYYDDNLTKHATTGLSQEREGAAAIPVDDYLMIVGGRGSGDPTGATTPIYRTEYFNADFTRYTNKSPDITKNMYNGMNSGMIGYGRVQDRILLKSPNVYVGQKEASCYIIDYE